MARAPLRDTDPAQVGRYRLTARLGTGGMGVVYLGTARDGRFVAVKVLRPDLADDPEFRDRFGREVANLTRVQGVCTVRVIEAETDSAFPFMATEYVPGPSLSEYIAAYGPPGPDMMYGLATGLAEALTVIHAAGIVHRDLKPSNVILGHDGPKVIDFGIAQALDATSVTRTGMMVGSAGFMAPEQVTGRPGPPADVFAWAVTLAYAASGQMPFGTGSADAVLYRILHAEPDTAAVPELLRPLVLASLAKDPQRRPRADELLARLTNQPRAGRDSEFGTQAVLAQTWPVTEAAPVQQPAMPESVLLEPAPAGARRPRRALVSRRSAAIAGPALAIAAAAVIFALIGHSQNSGQLAANQQQDTAVAAALGTYPGQQHRGVSQTVDRVVASRKHHRHHGLAEQRRRHPPAVLRLHRRRRSLAPGLRARVRRRGRPAGARGHPAGRRSRGLAGRRPAGHLDQRGRPVVDAGLNQRGPAAARGPAPGAQQHRSRVPGRGRGGGQRRRHPGRRLDLPERPDLGAQDRRAAGPDRLRRSRAGHHLRCLARQ